MTDRAGKWLYLIPFALALGALVPWIGKAFTIDDTLFLLQSKNALVDPLHPTAFDVVWDKNLWMRCSAIMPSGPVQAYLLVPALLMHGSETVAHATEILVLCLGLLGTIRLARAVGLTRPAATFAACIVAVSPCVIGMGSTVMPDVTAMSFGVLGLDQAVRWRQHRRWYHLIGWIVLLVLAGLSRPHAMAFAGVAFFAFADYDPTYPLIKRLRWRIVDMLPLVIVLGLTVGYGALIRDPVAAGGTLATSAQSLAGWVQPERHLISFFGHWVFTTPIILLLVIVVRGRLEWRIVAFLTIPIATLIVGIQYETQAWTAVFITLSIAALSELLRKNPSLPVPMFLAFAVGLLMPLPLITYVHLPAKYLVTAVPLGGVLIAAHWNVATIARWQKVAAGIVLSGYFVLSVQVVRSDAAFADLGKRAAVELIEPLTQKGETVWFAGHWGFQWYAMRANAIPLTLDAHPRPRDLLVRASWAYDGGPAADKFVSSLVTLHELPSDDATGFIMNADLGAGFYSNWWGLLPWVHGKAPLEHFTLMQFIYRTSDP